MNTIEKLGDEETFRQIVERSITSFIDDELTAIGMFSFYGCKELQEVSLPLVTELQDATFRGCSKLTAFDFSNVTKIGVETFYACGLTEVYGPIIRYLGGVTFRYCSSLVKAILPKVTYIGTSTFSDCSSLSSLVVGTELDDETAICTLDGTSSLPSSIDAIYVPYNLQDKYKTATNWSFFASKIQGYEQPVACQSLTITADNVAAYQTSTTIHWEATCTYSIEGMMQTGTMVFKGDVTSDTFGKNSSSDSSRSIEVSYTFLGKTATTTITQGKYVGDPLGGTIFYIDDTADGAYEFYDAEGNVIPSVAVGDSPAMYKVLTPGTKDKYYVCNTTLYPSLQWGMYNTSTGATGTAIGTGKSNTNIVMATSAATTSRTIWYQLAQTRSNSLEGYTDWFVPSEEEAEAVRASGIISFNDRSIWSSSELNSSMARWWRYSRWNNGSKYNSDSNVFFVRAF